MPPKSRPRKTMERKTDAEKEKRESASSHNVEYLEAKLAEIHAELEKERARGGLDLNIKSATRFLEEEDKAEGSSSDQGQVSDADSSAFGDDALSNEEPVLEDPPSPREYSSSEGGAASGSKDPLHEPVVDGPPSPRDIFSEGDAASGSEEPQLKDQQESDAHSDKEPGESPPSPRENFSEEDVVSGSEDGSDPPSPKERCNEADEASGNESPPVERLSSQEVSSDLFETSARSNQSPRREQDVVPKVEYQKLKDKLDKKTKELKNQKAKNKQLMEDFQELKDTCSYQATEIKRLQQNDPDVKAFSTVDGINLSSDDIAGISSKSKNAGVFAQNLAIALVGTDALRSMSVTGNGYSQSGEKIKKPRIPENVLNFIYGKVLEKNLIEKGSKGKYAVLAASNPSVINRALAEKIANLNKAYLVHHIKAANVQAPAELPTAKPTKTRTEAHSNSNSADRRKSQPVMPLHGEPGPSKRKSASSFQHPSSNSNKRSQPPASEDLGKSAQLKQIQPKHRTKDHTKSTRAELASKSRSNGGTATTSVRTSSQVRKPLSQPNRQESTRIQPQFGQEQKLRRSEPNDGKQIKMSQPERQPQSDQEQKLRRSDPNGGKRIRMSQPERPTSGHGLKVHFSQQLPPKKKQKNDHYSQQ